MSLSQSPIKDIEKIIQELNDGIIKNVVIKRLTAPGENYLSLVYRVDFDLDNNGRTETISAVAKRLPMGQTKFDLNSFAMTNEIKWYSEILPQIKKFAEEFGLNTDFYPEYLGARFSLDPLKTVADSNSVLLLRNLIPEGYKNEDRYVGFDLTTAKALLKVLAEFHAIPLIIKFKKPDFMEKLKEFLTNHLKSPVSNKEGPPEREHPPEELVISKMLEIPACQPYRDNIETLRHKPFKPPNMHKLGKEPWNTVIHSDYWVNNIMVKQRGKDELSVKMLDFQFCGYSSYAKDLVFFLLTSIRNDVQRGHFDELIRYYYEQLTSLLSRFDLPELRLTYDDYLEEIKRVAQESEACHAIFFSTVIFGTKGTGPDILMGEGHMFEHMNYLVRNMNEHQKEKLAIMAELAAKRGWI